MAAPATQTVDQSIRQLLQAVVDGQVGLGRLQDFLLTLFADRHGTDAPPLSPLADRVILRLAEFQNDDWSKSELRELLTNLARPDWTPESDEALVEAMDAPQDDDSSTGLQFTTTTSWATAPFRSGSFRFLRGAGPVIRSGTPA